MRLELGKSNAVDAGNGHSEGGIDTMHDKLLPGHIAGQAVDAADVRLDALRTQMELKGCSRKREEQREGHGQNVLRVFPFASRMMLRPLDVDWIGRPTRSKHCCGAA